MTRFFRAFACAAALLLIGGGLLLVHWSGASQADEGSPTGDPSIEPTTSATPTEEPSDDPSSDPPPSCRPDWVASGYFHDQGFEQSDYTVGEKSVEWSLIGSLHVDNPFSTHPLKSQAALMRFLDSDTAASRAARDLMGSSATEYVAVQFQTPIAYSGNWFWTEGKAEKGGENLLALTGDVWWIALDNCRVVEAKSIRAVCGNVGFTKLAAFAVRD